MRNARWVLVHQGRDGNTVLTQPAQGRFTYETADEAYGVRSAILSNNGADTLTQVYGPRFRETSGVRCVECWPGHNDPVATVY